MILDRYQYKGLSFQLVYGDAKAVVDTQVVSCKVGLPLVNWKLRFKNIDTVTRAYIEDVLYTYTEPVILKAHVNPRFIIYRDTRPDKKYYLTYYHEHIYYNGAVNRPIEYTTEGNEDILEGGIRIPHSGPIVTGINNSTAFSRQVYYLETKNTIVHEDFKIYSFDIVVKDFAKPVSSLVTEIVGESDVAYDSNC